MVSLGANPTVQELEEIINTVDVEQSGMIELEEFC